MADNRDSSHNKSDLSLDSSVNSTTIFSFKWTENVNLVNDRFKILFDSPITNLSNNFGSAYNIEDTKKDNNNFYVFAHNNNFPQRFKNIQILSEFKDDNMILIPKRPEIVPFEMSNDGKKEYHLCSILPLPPAISLYDHVLQKGPFNEAFVIEKLMLPILKTIMIYENLGIMHGGINPKNVYLTDKNEIILGDSIREICGFSQTAVYEPIERMLHSAIAKGEGDIAVDYFAYGVLLIYLLTGRNPHEKLRDVEIYDLRLAEGTYYGYSKDNDLSAHIKTLLKGILNDRVSERWGAKKIVEWLKGRKYNVPVLSLYKTSPRSFSGGIQNQHFNSASLGFELWQDWGNAKKVLKEPKLLKWLESSLGQEIAALRIDYAIKMNSISFSTFAIDDDELVTRCLLALDSETGIKYQNLCFGYEGLPNLLVAAFSKGSKDLIRAINKFISGGITALFLEIKAGALKTEEMNLTPLIEKCKNFFIHGSSGFGVERLLYEFNGNLPCQSSIVINYYCNDITRLLQALEKLAENLDIGNLDRHLIAFIFNKLDLRKEPELMDLTQYPDIAENRILKNLNILNIAQLASQAKKLPKISKKIVEHLDQVIDDIFKSLTFKKELKKKLNELYGEGSLQLIFDLVTDITTIAKDRIGFKIATRRFIALEELVSKNNSSKDIFNVGYSYGLKMGMVFSYIICSIVILYTISKA